MSTFNRRERRERRATLSLRFPRPPRLIVDSYSLVDIAEDDGLAQEWSGRVFLNPPFSQAKKFGDKLRLHYEQGEVPAAIMVRP